MSSCVGPVLRRQFGSECVRVGKSGIQITALAGRATTLEDHGDLVEAAFLIFKDPTPLGEAVTTLAESGYASAEIEAIIEFLRATGTLIETDQAATADSLVEMLNLLTSADGGPSEHLAVRLRNLPVVVVGSGLVASAAVDGLKAVGVQPRRSETASVQPGDFVIACADFDDFTLFEAVNAEGIATGATMFFARMSGVKLTLGPYVVPRELPCFHCYTSRLEANLSFIREHRARSVNGDYRSMPLSAEPGSLLRAGIQYHLVTSFIWAMLGVGGRQRISSIRMIDLAAAEVSTSPLLTAPRCRVCGAGHAADVKWAVRDLL